MRLVLRASASERVELAVSAWLACPPPLRGLRGTASAAWRRHRATTRPRALSQTYGTRRARYMAAGLGAGGVRAGDDRRRGRCRTRAARSGWRLRRLQDRRAGPCRSSRAVRRARSDGRPESGSARASGARTLSATRVSGSVTPVVSSPSRAAMCAAPSESRRRAEDDRSRRCDPESDPRTRSPNHPSIDIRVRQIEGSRAVAAAAPASAGAPRSPRRIGGELVGIDRRRQRALIQARCATPSACASDLRRPATISTAVVAIREVQRARLLAAAMRQHRDPRAASPRARPSAIGHGAGARRRARRRACRCRRRST